MKRLDPVYRQYEPIFGRELIRELLSREKIHSSHLDTLFFVYLSIDRKYKKR